MPDKIPDDIRFTDPPEFPDYVKEFEKKLADDIRTIVGAMESSILADQHPTTTSAMDQVQQNLTMADLQRAYEECWKGTHRPRVAYYDPAVSGYQLWPKFEPSGLLPATAILRIPNLGEEGYTGLFSNRLPVYTDEYMGDLVWPTCIIKRGPYFQRRLKRWRRTHPPKWVGNGQYLLTDNAIFCHPDDLPKLKQAIENFHPVDKEAL